MKWGNVVILCFDPEDAVCFNSAMLWRRRYSVPDTHAFFFSESLRVLAGYQPVALGCMSAVVTPLTKLIIIGHGNSRLAASMPVQRFARHMINYGAHQAGLMSIKCCQVGAGQFLNELSVLLPLVSWFVAPQGATTTKSIGGVTHDIVTTAGDFRDERLHDAGKKLRDEERVTIVQGKGGRYPLFKSKRYRDNKGKKEGCVIS